MSKDYYETLGVSKNASKGEIKKAFHKLAHVHHPDKNKGDDKKFKEVNEAYQTLSDDKKRANYDRFGSADMNGFSQNASGFGNMGGNAYGGGWDPSNFQGAEGFDIGDIFGDIFGGGRSRKNVRRGRDISTEINLSFEEAIFGVSRNIKINKQSKCNICGGNGAKVGSKMDTCKTCNGQGKVREVKRSIFGNFANVKTCDTCFGSGKVPSQKCSTCHGSGILKKDEDIKVNIPAGIKEEEMVRLNGMGEAILGGESGDLYVKVKIAKHDLYRREGLNLVMDIHIKLTDSLLGTVYKLKTLKGGVMEVKIPEGIKHGELLRVKGKGVPYSRGRGDIIIHIKVDIPKKLSRKSKELIEKLKEEGV